MTRFTKDDMESDAFAQKLNMMLWSRCKAGKITQSEYMALVENRDVNLKRMIAEKNLTLDEAKQVRNLVMKYHLTMTVAINIAKEKITLAQGRKACQPKAGKTKAVKPAQKTKKARSGITKEISSDAAGSNGQMVSATKKGKTARPQPSLRKAKPSQEKPQKAKQPVAREPQKQRPSRDVTQQKRVEKTAPGVVKNVQKNQKTNQQPQGEGYSQKQPHHNKGHHDHPRREEKQEPRPYEVYYDDGIGAPASGMRFYGSSRGDAEADRQWRDWRDERNAQMRSQQTSNALPPIPPGQDWYPGMGFRPADDPPASYTPAAPAENKPAPREQTSPRPVSPEKNNNRPDFQKNRNEFRRKNWHGDRRKAQMPRRDMEIRREVREAEAQHQKQMNPEAGNKNPASAVFRGNAHPSMGRHSFSHVRRFVPRKKTGKRPEGSTQ